MNMNPSRRTFLQLAGTAIATPALLSDRPHLVLLGDSTFANGAYTRGAPDVAARLRETVGEDVRVSLLAVDGAVLANVPAQLARLPNDATHLILSAGGNDALRRQRLLKAPASSVAAALDLLAQAVADFEAAYRNTVLACLARRLPLTVCTVYNGNFNDPVQRRRLRTAIALFDDAILRIAAERRLCAVDLRLVCNQPADYANQIEPSSAGAAKMARAIIEAVSAGTPEHGALLFGVPSSPV